MWDKEIQELERRKQIAYQMGGEENVAKQHSSGKVTVRERIDALIDKGSFRERGVLAGVPTYDAQDKNKLLDLVPCPFVMGIAKIDGRKVAVHGDDFTIKGLLSAECTRPKAHIF